MNRRTTLAARAADSSQLDGNCGRADRDIVGMAFDHDREIGRGQHAAHGAQSADRAKVETGFARREQALALIST
jgi:hypothetical protein